MRKAMLSEEAFVAMLASCAEVYDKEAYGMLLGRKSRNMIYIENAVPFQSCRRTSIGVVVVQKAEKRLLSAMNFLTGYRYIGDYHSHSNFVCGLSQCDIDDLIEFGEGLSILVAMKESKRHIPWQYDEAQKCIKGSIDKMYYIVLKIYWHEHGTRKVNKLPIGCGFLAALNRRVRKMHF